MSGVLRDLYALIDGPGAEQYARHARRRSALLDPVLHGPGEAHDFAGGRAEFDRYMAQRGAPTWTHHVLAEWDGDVEVVFGETRQDGGPVASFVAAIRLDADGLISRYLVGRSPAVLFGSQLGQPQRGDCAPA